MEQLLSIVDDKIVINKARLRYTEGTITHAGDLNVAGKTVFAGTVALERNLTVAGTAEIEVLKVKQLITSDSDQHDAFTFSADSYEKLVGRGLLWHEPNLTHQLVLKDGPQRIWSSQNIDLHRMAKYQINAIDVLSADRLGDSVQFSNLRKVGTLDSLKVTGDTELAQTVKINSAMGRVGINTDQPNGALSVVDDLVEVVIKAYNVEQAYIGTWSNQQLNIGTDNTSRIVINGNTTTFGSAKSKNAVVKINGALEVNQLRVDELVADTRIERTTPIEFKYTAAESAYNKGLLWTNETSKHSLFLVGGPDRIQSTAHISLVAGKEFIINGNTVISETAIGPSVTESELTKVGTLTSLNVAGVLAVDSTAISASTAIQVTDESGSLTVTGKAITSNNISFSINTQEATEFALDSQGNIQLGNKENTSRVINAYGRLSVNVSNPRPDAAFVVDGAVVINGKKQIHGIEPPTDGQWIKGDICWNLEPQETSYVGWVCVASGTPGTWKPFGYISE